jgi:hypothetical protein
VLVVVVFVCVILLKKRRDDGVQRDVNAKGVGGAGYVGQDSGVDATVEKFARHSFVCLIAALLLSVVGVVVFLLTEDMSLSRGWVDWWTIVNAVLFVVEISFIAFVFHNKKVASKQDKKPESTSA